MCDKKNGRTGQSAREASFRMIMQHDYLIRAIAADDQIRAFAVDSTGICEYARQIHNNSPLASEALGRMLSAGLMMGQMLKSNEDKLTLQILGDGPMHHIIVTSGLYGTVRGYVSNPSVTNEENSPFDILKAIGPNASLTVIRDMGLKEPYVSSINLQSGEIADDLTFYFVQSEQTPTSVRLGVLVDDSEKVQASGGFIIQLMPFTKPEVISKLQDNLQKIKTVTELFQEGKTIEEILNQALEGFDVRITDKKSVSWGCNCSFERGKEVLSTLKDSDLTSMIEDGKNIEVNCDFCAKTYVYTPDDIRKILEKKHRRQA